MKRTMYSILPLLVLVLPPAPIYGAEQNAVVSRDAKIDNVQLHYLTAGHGPTVLLLHGFAETSRMWRPLIPLLAEKFTVIAPGLPGIGALRHCLITRSLLDGAFGFLDLLYAGLAPL